MEYRAFLESKRVAAEATGFGPGPINPKLHEWQARIVDWSCRRGKAGIWAGTGLGKTPMQLEWARQVHEHANGDVLILAPLAVARQTAREAEKFGIGPVTLCRSQSDVKPGINVTNYQRLKDFDASHFAGVVTDEGDILANFTGQTKRAIVSAFAATPYKLDCSATPAPNDHMELGNHADFLGVMESNEMLSRWFINDAGEAGNYRLKKHAEADFWRWVASWSVALTKPSDLGYDDGAFALPPLHVVDHVVDVDIADGADDGMLFRIPTMSATSMHAEMRRTSEARAGKAAELVAAKPGVPWVIWCNTDYEAKAIRDAIPDVVEIRGPDPIDRKEELIDAFSRGEIARLLTKPAICSHGLNWQHVRDTVCVGLSYSFKQLFQLIRRFWRHGQTGDVFAHIVTASTEGRVRESILRKHADHERMIASMVAAMAMHGLGADTRRDTSAYEPTMPIRLPDWLNAEGACR